MMSDKVLQIVCVFALCELAITKMIDVSKVDLTALYQPSIKYTALSAQSYVNNFCVDWQNGDAFPHPDSCESFLMCWEGTLYELTCSLGQLFDPRHGWCDEARNVVCLNEPVNPTCPPAGSNELRFVPSTFCEDFYVCINGHLIVHKCRPGQHWNAVRMFCDDPWTAGCDLNATPTSGQGPTCPARFTGQLSHPQSCSLYINCVNGNQTVLQCRPSQLFDAFARRCVAQATARCAA